MIYWASFFLIYINDLTSDLKSNVKLFANNTPLFSIVYDFEKIRDSAEQSKMVFNSDPTKQNSRSRFFQRKPLKDLFILILTVIDLLLEKAKNQIYFGLKLDKI